MRRQKYLSPAGIGKIYTVKTWRKTDKLFADEGGAAVREMRQLYRSVKNAKTGKMVSCCEKNDCFSAFLEENQKSVKLTTRTEGKI